MPGFAGQQTWDFTTDPGTGANPLLYGGNGINPGEWQPEGGNPGGFLGLTWAVNGQVSIVRFPNIDPGKVVTAFKFEADLRVGNSVGDRAADGFSVSFARDGDPALDETNVTTGNQGVFAGGIAEGGTTTGIAISFDTWSGNTLPDGADIEGIIVRVDNQTVLRQALPTRHGACDDATSLQTGPRDPAFWANGGDYQDPASWAGLCWQPVVVELLEDGKLTVQWKGKTILDQFQTAYFPTAGALVLAGRTGNANEHTHFDNITLTTTAASCASAPTAPANVRATETGTRRVLLAWDPSSVAGDPGARLAYEVERDGTVIATSLTSTTYEAVNLDPSKAYRFAVRAKNVCADASSPGEVTVTTVAEVDSIGYLTAQVYRTASDGTTAFTGATQFDMETVINDPKYPNSPDNQYYVNGFQFGEPAFGDTYGENHLVRIAGVFRAPKTGSFRFYTRSDDASRIYVNTSGAAIPNAQTDAPLAQENGCCGPFEAPGAGENADDGTFPTTEPINLTAGNSYGILYLVKEGGGGDWGQLGILENGSTGAVQPITGPSVLGGKGDAVGAVANITTQPANASVQAYHAASFSVVAETSSPYRATAFYQWYKNGEIILGANQPTYTIPVALPTDDGAKFKVLVGVVGKSVESAEATLTVTAGQPAKITAVSGSDSYTAATLTFDQPVTAPSATTAGNYTVAGLTVSAAALVDQYTVRLTTSQQAEGTTYAVTARNVANLGGAAAETTGSLVSWSMVAGRARADQYTGFTGATDGDIDTVLADPKWVNQTPDVVRYVNGLSYGEPAFGD
ncbi:MAG: PA14 domain-containing protein, partial [Limisphaerales bacterium]